MLLTQTIPSSIRDQRCPNAACIFFKLSSKGNIVIHGRTPPRFRCTQCSHTWVAHRGELAYRHRGGREKIEQVLGLLRLPLSIRKTAFRCHLSPSTVYRWKKKFLSDSS